MENNANQGSVSQFPCRESSKERKKILIGSGTWNRTAEFLEFAPRGELKEFISLSYKDAIRVTAVGGASAVPAGEGSSPLLPGGSGISLPAL